MEAGKKNYKKEAKARKLAKMYEEVLDNLPTGFTHAVVEP